MSRLILVLGDQLTHSVAALREGCRETDTVVMAEVMAEATYAPHHPKKIAFLFSAMRHFADELRRAGWRVRYTALDDPDNAGSIPGELLRAAEATGCTEVVATEPGEWRLISALEDCPVPVHLFADDRFLCPRPAFEAWAERRRSLRMEWFYRDMRRRTGLLMDGDRPAGAAGTSTWRTAARRPPRSAARGRSGSSPTRRPRPSCGSWRSASPPTTIPTARSGSPSPALRRSMRSTASSSTPCRASATIRTR